MAAAFIIGWQEWLALPELGLPAIKAKIDTGARSSALHAFLIEPFGSARQPMVRFGVHPIPGRLDVAVYCSAAVVDRREVTSSNGEKETRFFIRTPVALGDRTWPIEIGLTNRESMNYRMLLGRQGIGDDMMVDVGGSFRQPRLSYKAYRSLPREQPVRRPLRIALIAKEAGAAFNRTLAEAAAARGHTLELLDLDRHTLEFRVEEAIVAFDGVALEHYDAVIPRLGRRDSAIGAAIVRQLGMMGCVSLNPAAAIDRVADRIATAQALLSGRIPQSIAAGSADAAAPVAPDQILRVLVVGDQAVAMLRKRGDRVRNTGLSRHRTEQRLAEDAAAALGLGLAAIDIETSGAHPVVAAATAHPRLGVFAHTSGADVVSAVIDAVEARVTTLARSSIS